MAFTDSLQVMEDAEAPLLSQSCLRNDGRRKAGARGRQDRADLDKTYAMAYINEPVDEPLTVPPAHQEADESVDPNAQASSDRASMGVTDETGVGDGGVDWTGSAKEESEEAARGPASVVTRGSAAGGSALQRQIPGGLTPKSDPAGPTDYRGQPASPGEWSTAAPRTPAGNPTRPGDLTAGRRPANGRTSAAPFGPTDASVRPDGQSEEDDELADDSSDAPPSEENLPAEPTESPRPRDLAAARWALVRHSTASRELASDDGLGRRSGLGNDALFGRGTDATGSDDRDRWPARHEKPVERGLGTQWWVGKSFCPPVDRDWGESMADDSVCPKRAIRSRSDRSDDDPDSPTGRWAAATHDGTDTNAVSTHDRRAADGFAVPRSSLKRAFSLRGCFHRDSRAQFFESGNLWLS